MTDQPLRVAVISSAEGVSQAWLGVESEVTSRVKNARKDSRRIQCLLCVLTQLIIIMILDEGFKKSK